MEVIGHADRAVPLRDYCLGLLMPSEGKSCENVPNRDPIHDLATALILF
jgi:SRSO17 transposase